MFLDHIEHLYININKKEVFVMHNKQKFPILKIIAKSSYNVFKLKRETIERIIEIVNKNKTNKTVAVETLNTKVET